MGLGREVSRMVDRSGFGMFQLKHFVFGGSVYMSECSEILLIGCVANSLRDSLGLTARESAAIVSLVFVGMVLGSGFIGWIGDNFGRRRPIVMAYFLMAFGGIMSTYSNGVYSLGFCRFFCGLAVGIGVPCWVCLATEITPTSKRPHAQAMGILMAVIGELYASFLLFMDSPNFKNLHWRKLLLLGTIPAIIMVALSVLFLTESPHYLAVRKNKEEAQKVLKRMAVENGCHVFASNHDDDDPQTLSGGSDIEQNTSDNSNWREDLPFLFGKRFRYTTLVMTMLASTMFMTNVALVYVIPQVLADATNLPISPAQNMLWCSCMCIPAALVGCWVGVHCDRTYSLQFFYVVLGLGVLCFGLTSRNLMVDDWGTWNYSTALAFGSHMGVKFANNVIWVLNSIYICELFPTTVRVSGPAFCLCVGRIVMIFSPMLYEYLLQITGSFLSFFVLLSGVCILDVVLITFLPFETRDTLLSASFKESFAKSYFSTSISH